MVYFLRDYSLIRTLFPHFLYVLALEAWIKWLRVGEGLWEVPNSSLNGHKNLPIKKN